MITNSDQKFFLPLSSSSLLSLPLLLSLEFDSPVKFLLLRIRIFFQVHHLHLHLFLSRFFLSFFSLSTSVSKRSSGVDYDQVEQKAGCESRRCEIYQRERKKEEEREIIVNESVGQEKKLISSPVDRDHHQPLPHLFFLLSFLLLLFSLSFSFLPLFLAPGEISVLTLNHTKVSPEFSSSLISCLDLILSALHFFLSLSLSSLFPFFIFLQFFSFSLFLFSRFISPRNFLKR